MNWLNYHHLRYFWMVAKEGSLARAAGKLHISQPSISEQIHELETALGEKLFRREGRKNRLTDAGQMVFGYAEEIFGLGREMLNSVKQRPGAKTLQLCVGITDSLPKSVINDILKPVFTRPQPAHVICREGKLEELLPQLVAHRLDLVLSDESAPSGAHYKTFNHLLDECGTTFFAENKLARRLAPAFPQSLHEAPALLPAENTMLRRGLEGWFRDQHVRPRVVVECEDLALMKVMAAEGLGFIAVPSLARNDAVKGYGFRVVGEAESCRFPIHAITIERRIEHPAATSIIAKGKTSVHGN